MRLYVESNFVLELAFHQEHSADCEQLLQFAETGELQLVVPSYCLAEPHETLARRHKKRLSLQNDIQAELGQLRRSINYRKVAEQVNLASSLFATSAQDRERLADVITRLSEAGRLVPVTRAVVRRAYEVQRDLAMGPQDSFVLASVLHDLDDYRLFVSKWGSGVTRVPVEVPS
jgi:hypothetical protein